MAPQHALSTPPQQEPQPGEHGRVRGVLFGRPLHSEEAPHQTIGKAVGLAVFASDALSSVAYATQEILYVLALAGAAAFSVSLPIAGAICVLLIILTLSYRQTIYAYPSGGGAYIVARENLGESPAQVAGAALLTDYVLTVAVSIASGVEQIASAFPAIHPYRVVVCVGIIAFMTIVNLRGVKESGRVFALPTYMFIAMTLLLLVVGTWRWATGHLPAVTGVQSEIKALQPLTIFLILRAFSSGCTALTGVEAISNGIPAFKVPKSQNAATTMAYMSGTLMVMFLGITLLAHQIHALPSETETVISQLGRSIFGTNVLYYVMLASTTLILILAANTSYADFPRLAALQAGDGFLPRQLILRGQRLVFSIGIIALAVFAATLIVVFNARTTALIPLYAIGVFMSFTMSQAGMVRHWLTISRLKPGEEHPTRGSVLHYDRQWSSKLVINALGCAMTAVVTVVFAITKFSQGAWIVVILIPTLVFLFFRIHRHYVAVAKALSLANYEAVRAPVENSVVILVSSVHRGTLEAVRYARNIKAKKMVGLYVELDPQLTATVRERWERWVPDIELVVLPSPYRRLIPRIVNYVDSLGKQHGTAAVTVVIPEFVAAKWWHHLLHNQTALMIKRAFLFDRDTIVVDVPYHLEE